MIIHYVYMGNHIHIDHSRARIRGEEGQDSDIQTMRSEEQVAEEFGSWHEYMELQRQVGRAGRSWQFHWTKWRYVTIVYHIVKETIYIYYIYIYIISIYIYIHSSYQVYPNKWGGFNSYDFLWLYPFDHVYINIYNLTCSPEYRGMLTHATCNLDHGLDATCFLVCKTCVFFCIGIHQKTWFLHTKKHWVLLYTPSIVITNVIFGCCSFLGLHWYPDMKVWSNVCFAALLCANPVLKSFDHWPNKGSIWMPFFSNFQQSDK